MTGQFRSDLGWYAALAGVNGAYGVYQFFAQHALKQIPLGAGLQRARCLHITGIGSEHHAACARPLFKDRANGFDPIHPRHLQVDQSHIGPELRKRLDGLVTIGSFAHQLHIGLPMQHVGNPFQDQGMVVDGQDSNSIGAHRCCTHGVCLPSNLPRAGADHQPAPSIKPCIHRIGAGP